MLMDFLENFINIMKGIPFRNRIIDITRKEE
jgi:hypothetical protein